MSNEIRVPDIGDFDAVDVIEVLIKAGDSVENGQSVIVLESDKASMEVPADSAGTIASVAIKVGDKVKQGDLIATLSGAAAAPAAAAPAPAAEAPKAAPAAPAAAAAQTDIRVPDIGDFDAVDVIEVLIKAGDSVENGQSVIVLESDKASMEVPAEAAGTVASVAIKVGDKVKQGDLIATLSGAAAAAAPAPAAEAPKAAPAPAPQAAPAAAPATVAAPAPAPSANPQIDEAGFATAHASPSIRRIAREMGLDLGKVQGSGRLGRILESDIRAFVKTLLTSGGVAAAAAGGKSGAVSGAAPQGMSGIPPIPAVDFSQFGEIEEQPLSRINVLTGAAMTRCWLNIPHVTQHDYADITELEAFRVSLKAEAEKRGVRVTMLAFLMKALTSALKELPRFNSSLSPDGKALILKKYYNIGIAVDTPNGLVVPVIRDVDQKGIYDLSADLAAISKKAREGKLSPKDMSGASMTISSLGGIGGTFFTPIVNAPEVAILGVSRSAMQPVWNGKDFAPRLMLPMSLSYDHRVIDGALGARMTSLLAQILGDMKRTLL
ncbi:dihydrolipoyllysine-residue acetyltransferase [Cardiobacterium hominis]|uniref:dihydrolipoyllysine-residue acetyltransferase n=1 Tax=Cardiobacterium hominis TaxID=2718 RepID=UPI0028EF302B|nr:dihydrolipoyllysine-residue acetyltransferase [Cardiobacterium hominis]